MPPLPGEERLVTVYADIHYYFAPPSIRPVLHRFDKACYFYIYWNSTRQSARIEVANNAGTTDQDAFHGYLDKCRVINSHRFPCLLTLVVDAIGSASSSPTTRPGRDPDEWRLPSNDPRDPGKTKYKLHTLDIYFWAQDDAKLVVDSLKKLLQPAQLDVAELEPEDEPPSHDRHQEAMSPVVQNLENVAISDPSYQNGQTRNSLGQPQQLPITLPPPPPPQQQPPAQQPYNPTSSISPVSAMSQSQSAHSSAKPQEPAQSFAPIAYNPAAPPPPEPIAHREDTPPPPDDGQGTGLAAAAIHDHPTAYVQSTPQPWGGPPQPGHQPYQIGQPQHQTYGSPPPPSVPSTLSGPTAVSAGSDPRHHSTAAEHYVPSPPNQHAHLYNQQSVETPGAQFYSTNPNQAHKPLQHNQPQYADYLSSNAQNQPAGGYSQYDYSHSQQPQQQQQQGGNNPYDVHGQVYRPTETEHAHHNRKHSRTGTNPTGDKSKWETRADKVEKKGGKYLKKLGF